MPGKKWLVHGDILNGDNALLTDEVDHAVDQQERITVRQDSQDVLDIEMYMLGRRLSHSLGGVAHACWLERRLYFIEPAGPQNRVARASSP